MKLAIAAMVAHGNAAAMALIWAALSGCGRRAVPFPVEVRAAFLAGV
jgi:hypothetical protein